MPAFAPRLYIRAGKQGATGLGRKAPTCKQTVVGPTALSPEERFANQPVDQINGPAGDKQSESALRRRSRGRAGLDQVAVDGAELPGGRHRAGRL